MKKLLQIGLVALIALECAAFIVYKAVNKAPSDELPLNLQVSEIFTAGGCLSCHSADPVLPFYAKLPVAGDVVMKDIEDGYRAFDMTGFMDAVAAGSLLTRWILPKSRKSCSMTVCRCRNTTLYIGEVHLTKRKEISSLSG